MHKEAVRLLSLQRHPLHAQAPFNLSVMTCHSLERTQANPLYLSENLISYHARWSNRAEQPPFRSGFDYLAKADIKSLDFTVTRFLMKLFRTTNIDVIEECRLFFNFLFPSEVLEMRRDRTNSPKSYSADVSEMLLMLSIFGTLRDFNFR